MRRLREAIMRSTIRARGRNEWWLLGLMCFIHEAVGTAKFDRAVIHARKGVTVQAPTTDEGRGA